MLPVIKVFSNAAEMLGSNQPNITRCMNILENELDCKLLIRSHKGIQLTTEGDTCSVTLPLQLNSSPMEKKKLSKTRALKADRSPSESVKQPCVCIFWIKSRNFTKIITCAPENFQSFHPTGHRCLRKRSG